MQKTTIISIIPLLVFVALFLGSGLYFDNFYSLPAPIIALFSVVVALLIYRAPMKEKIWLGHLLRWLMLWEVHIVL